LALLVHLGQLCATRWKDKDLKALINKDFVLAIQSTDTTILYLQEKVKAGVDAVQVLILGAECCLQLIIKILLEIHQSDYRSFGRSCSSNCFGKGCWFANEMGKSRASALGVDWTCSPRNARYLSGGNIFTR
jgi:uroporphyrinogen decarboxylase